MNNHRLLDIKGKPLILILKKSLKQNKKDLCQVKALEIFLKRRRGEKGQKEETNPEVTENEEGRGDNNNIRKLLELGN